MKTSSKLYIVAAFVIVAILVAHFTFGLFCRYNYFTAKAGIKKNAPVYITADEGATINLCKKQIAQEQGFDVVLLDLINSNSIALRGISIHNEITNKYLVHQKGENWHTEYLQAVDSLFKENQKDTITQIVLAQPEVKKLNHYLDSISNGTEQLKVWYFPQEKEEANVAVSREMSDQSIAIFYYYQVDPYSLAIESIKK